MAKVQVTVFGLDFGQGTSKAGNPYAFCRMNYLVPARPFKSDKHDIQKIGTEPKAVELIQDQKLFDSAKTFNYPLLMELTIEPHPDDITSNIVTGFAPLPVGQLKTA
ncbi:hypothetical protein [Plesiomonas shigelloides]|uniref:hypothetical protein n=1 Tax=Plesiomonas shigelloides TaxID=703 RepID=UPI001261EE33|nr:hypothetical protein [Plesiomonas shigelloides]KAB7674369.1 hypothetical protein GBN16_12840 [Plesiomonas shigelloides]